MIMYEYKCEQCGFNFERLQNMYEEPTEKCPRCGGKLNIVIGSDINTMSKGSDFYADDYGGGPGKGLRKSCDTKTNKANR